MVMKRPDLRAYFRSRIDYHVNGMFARTVSRPHDVKSIVGDVTDREIVVTMLDGSVYKWSGGRYASRKVNLCYAPLMPKPIVEPGSTRQCDVCREQKGSTHYVPAARRFECDDCEKGN